MTAPFDISYDPSTRLTRIAMRGFWDQATLWRFTSDLARIAADTAYQPDTGGRVLVDLREFDIQSRAIPDQLPGMVDQVARKASWFAVVSSGSAIQNLQIARALPASRTRVFTNNREAEAWLHAVVTDGTPSIHQPAPSDRAA